MLFATSYLFLRQLPACPAKTKQQEKIYDLGDSILLRADSMASGSWTSGYIRTTSQVR